MQKHELEAMMKLNGDTGGTLAQFLGINRSTFSAKLNRTGGAEFTQGEISQIKLKYSLSAEQVDRIFFADEVS